jgi:hypothetical protein
MVVLVVVAFVYMQDKESLLIEFFSTFTPPNWDEVSPRDIVKNSIPITLIGMDGKDCAVEAMRFNDIIDHQYFVKGKQLADELNYDRNLNTLSIPCEKLGAEKSEFTIWYATEEASKHATKYQYWIKEWNNTQSDK